MQGRGLARKPRALNRHLGRVRSYHGSPIKLHTGILLFSSPACTSQLQPRYSFGRCGFKMTEQQPRNVVEGATGDIEDERPAVKSAEDRKAASALASLDSTDDASGASKNVDQEAAGQAMKNLGAGGAAISAAPAAAKKTVKVDAADVTLLVQKLELPKAKVTEMLKASDGDAVVAMRNYLAPAF